MEPGGSTQNTLDSALYQTRYYNVLVLSGPFENSLPCEKDVQVEIIPELKREISFIEDFKAFLRIYKIIKSTSPQVVHTHTSKAGILGRWAVWLHNRQNYSKKIITIHTPHGHVFYGYFGKIKTLFFLMIEKLTSRITDYFVALTPSEMEESLKYGIGKKEKWQVIHSGIKFQSGSYSNARKEFNIEPEEIVLGTISRLEPVKGIEYFIKAANELEKRKTDKKLKYIIMGDGSLRQSLENLSESLGIGNKIIFLGFQEDVYKFLSIMNIYIQPSMNEAMGRTIIQAQFMRLPVIASKVCGIPDAMKDNFTGILVEPGNAKAIADAVEIFVKDDRKRNSAGDAARKWVLEKDFTGYPKFSAESMNIKLKNFYTKILLTGEKHA
jgi:glycosyltransferase involved in cell wall biosynthesis